MADKNAAGVESGFNYSLGSFVSDTAVPPYISRPMSYIMQDSKAENGLERYPSVMNSYSGADITATLIVPGEKYAMNLGDLQTISWSTHRENKPVRGIGHVNPCGFVKGPRTISGSLIFTQFDRYTFYRLEHYKLLTQQGLYSLGDMLPPFDVVITAANEYASFSKMKILGVTIVDEGGVMSVDDMVTETTMTYMARGIQPMVEYTPNGFVRDPTVDRIQYAQPERDEIILRP